MSLYKKHCLYHIFYEQENVSDNSTCQKKFTTGNSSDTFCNSCRKKATKHRKKGNLGIKHIFNIYNPLIICKINCITIADFQQMPADKINRLGIFGKDFILLKFKGNK